MTKTKNAPALHERSIERWVGSNLEHLEIATVDFPLLILIFNQIVHSFINAETLFSGQFVLTELAVRRGPEHFPFLFEQKKNPLQAQASSRNTITNSCSDNQFCFDRIHQLILCCYLHS